MLLPSTLAPWYAKRMLINVPRCDWPDCTNDALWHVAMRQYVCMVTPLIRLDLCREHLDPWGLEAIAEKREEKT